MGAVHTGALHRDALQTVHRCPGHRVMAARHPGVVAAGAA
jgi:hypothetical protein